MSKLLKLLPLCLFLIACDSSFQRAQLNQENLTALEGIKLISGDQQYRVHKDLTQTYLVGADNTVTVKVYPGKRIKSVKLKIGTHELPADHERPFVFHINIVGLSLKFYETYPMLITGIRVRNGERERVVISRSSAVFIPPYAPPLPPPPEEPPLEPPPNDPPPSDDPSDPTAIIYEQTFDDLTSSQISQFNLMGTDPTQIGNVFFKDDNKPIHNEIRFGTRGHHLFIENGVMNARLTKSGFTENKYHHSNYEPNVDSYFTVNGRSAKFETEYWYSFRLKLDSNWKTTGFDNGDWEILTQWKDMPLDHSEERARNPVVAISTDLVNGKVHYKLTIRADSKELTLNKDYTRQSSYDLGPIGPDIGQWVTWTMNVRWSSGNTGFLELYKNGNKVHSESGRPNCYNDSNGPVWSIDIYKWFDPEDTDVLRAQTDDIRIGNKNATLQQMMK